MCSSYEVLLTKYAIDDVKIVRLSQKFMKTVRIIMIHFNDTKNVSEPFRNMKCHIMFGCIVSLSCDMYYKTPSCKSKGFNIQITVFCKYMNNN